MITYLINRLKGTEDYPLKSYESKTLRLIRAASWRLRWRSTRSLYEAYHQWSTDAYCAGWMHDSPAHIKMFVEWALARPIDRS